MLNVLYCLLIVTLSAGVATVLYRQAYTYLVKDDPDDYFYQSYLVAFFWSLASIGSLYTQVITNNGSFLQAVFVCVLGSILFLFFHSFSDFKNDRYT